MSNIKNAEILLDNIFAAPDYMPSQWENDFLEGIKNAIIKGGNLSEKQMNCLQKIYRKSAGG